MDSVGSKRNRNYSDGGRERGLETKNQALNTIPSSFFVGLGFVDS